MNVVILNGMEPGNGSVASVQDIVVRAIEERDWNVEPFLLHDLDVLQCGHLQTRREGTWRQLRARA
jgi:hypothetical protein